MIKQNIIYIGEAIANFVEKISVDKFKFDVAIKIGDIISNKITVFYIVVELRCRGIFSKFLKKSFFLLIFQNIVVE